MIYLDYAATTPISEEALSVYSEVARKFPGNPSSIHDYGSSAQEVLEAARGTLANLLNVESRGIYFTGSGSEANSLSIQSMVAGNKKKGNHIIATGAEHSCVRSVMKVLKSNGYEISTLPLFEDGRVKLDKLEETIREDTILISVHHANSEIGTLQDITSIGEIARSHDVLFHSDCVQSFGKVPIEVSESNLDSLSISAHKIYGPKGIGACYISPSERWKPVFPGASQEKGFRPGTVDTPAAAAFAAAAKDIFGNMDENRESVVDLRNYFLDKIDALPFDITIEGSSEHVLPHIIGLRISGIEGQYAMLECNRHGLAISTGSACSVGTEKESATMRALKRDTQESREFIRLSMGKKTTKDKIDKSIEILEKVLTEHFNMVKL